MPLKSQSDEDFVVLLLRKVADVFYCKFDNQSSLCYTPVSGSRCSENLQQPECTGLQRPLRTDPHSLDSCSCLVSLSIRDPNEINRKWRTTGAQTQDMTAPPEQSERDRTEVLMKAEHLCGLRTALFSLWCYKQAFCAAGRWHLVNSNKINCCQARAKESCCQTLPFLWLSFTLAGFSGGNFKAKISIKPDDFWQHRPDDCDGFDLQGCRWGRRGPSLNARSFFKRRQRVTVVGSSRGRTGYLLTLMELTNTLTSELFTHQRQGNRNNTGVAVHQQPWPPTLQRTRGQRSRSLRSSSTVSSGVQNGTIYEHVWRSDLILSVTLQSFWPKVK